MGLFDDIRCQYPLPNSEVQGETFQTKDLGCGLDVYTITEDGRLLWTYRSHSGNKTDIHLPYDGDLVFYVSTYPDGYPGRHEWYEYCAVFDAGVLQSIVRKEDEG